MDTLVTETEPTNHAECVQHMVPISEVLAQIGGKWTIYIISLLTHGPMRFSELKRHIEGVSQKMLTSTLRDLERDGLVTRTVTPSIPPRVDYELTEMGRELREPLSTLSRWAVGNRDRVQAARERYSEAQGQRQAAAW